MSRLQSYLLSDGETDGENDSGWGQVPKNGSKAHNRLFEQQANRPSSPINLVGPPNKRAIYMESIGHTLTYCLNSKCSHAKTGGAWTCNDMDMLQMHCKFCPKLMPHAIFQHHVPLGQVQVFGTLKPGPNAQKPKRAILQNGQSVNVYNNGDAIFSGAAQHFPSSPWRSGRPDTNIMTNGA